MANSIKSISNGEPYSIRFKKTIIYKRIYGKEEQKIAEYEFEKGDFEYSEIVWRVPFDRGPFTWFYFNKQERLRQLGVIDDYIDKYMGRFEYKFENNIELVVSHSNEGQHLNIMIQKNIHGYMADIMISYPNWYFRIHLEDPVEGSFE